MSLICWQDICFKHWAIAFFSHFCLSFFISEKCQSGQVRGKTTVNGLLLLPLMPVAGSANWSRCPVPLSMCHPSLVFNIKSYLFNSPRLKPSVLRLRTLKGHLNVISVIFIHSSQEMLDKIDRALIEFTGFPQQKC